MLVSRSTTFAGSSNCATVGAPGSPNATAHDSVPPVRSYRKGVLLSLAPPGSRGTFGLMKLRVVLKLGVVESDIEVDTSARPDHLPLCQLAPSRNISLSVRREFVSDENRRFGSSSSAAKSTPITPRSAASMEPRFWEPLRPSIEPKLIVSKAPGTETFLRLLTPDPCTLELSCLRS